MSGFDQYKKLIILALGILALFIIYEIIFNVFFNKGTLEINAKPTEITIAVRKKSYKTPLNILLPSGTYLINASKDGFTDQEATIQIKRSQVTKLYFDMISNEVIEPTRYKIPEAIHQLPIETSNFRMDWEYDSNTITIVPMLQYGNDNPEIFIKQNWSQYEKFGMEALQWLEDNGIGRKIREENQIRINWWLEEFWSSEASIAL